MSEDTAWGDTSRADKLAYYLLKSVNKSVYQQHMLRDDDHVLVAVSGGKDSMSMLDLLYRRQVTSRERYTMMVGHVRTDYHCGRAVSPDWLAAWCASHSIPFVCETLTVAADIAGADGSKCFRCAWFRRKALFEMAGRFKCGKIAFAHHADDIAETTLMNLFFNARLRAMEPRMSLFEGRLVLIRPMALVEERDIVPFARASGYPITGEPCPEGERSRRALVKRLLREVESDCYDVKRHIYRAAEFCRERPGEETARAQCANQDP